MAEGPNILLAGIIKILQSDFSTNYPLGVIKGIISDRKSRAILNPLCFSIHFNFVNFSRLRFKMLARETHQEGKRHFVET